MLAQVGNQGNVGNQNGNVINENVQENVGDMIVNGNRKMESVQDMSGCSIDQKVKYTAGSFVGKDLTWWNSQIRTLSWEVVVIGAGHATYTNRFHELARLVPHLVTPESRKIERYVYVLAPQIRRMVEATKPNTIQKAVQIFGALTDEAVRNGSVKKVEKRGNMGEPSKDKNGRDDNKRTRTGNAFASTVNPVGRENMGTWPKCATCNSYHAPGGPCRTCFNCNRSGLLANDYRGVPMKVNPVNARNPTIRSCYECGSGIEPSELAFRYEIEIACGQLVEIDKLEAHGAEVSTEDANHKFLRSLPPAWSNLAMTMRTKPDVDTLSIDNLYNNLSLRVFKQEMQGVPHPLSGDYTPKPQEEIDESLYVYGKKGPQEPEPNVSDDRSSEYSTCQYNDSAGSIGTSSEHSVDPESKILRVPQEVYVSKPITTNEKGVSAPKSKEVEPSCVTHIKTPRQPIKDQETPKVNRKNWNAMMERELGEGYSFTKKKCFVCGSLSHLIKDCDYYEKKMAREAEFKKQRVFNTGNGVAKPVWTNANRVNHANQFVPRSVQLNAGRPNINSVRPNINTGRTNRRERDERKKKRN
ncbi:hypothetical protein Tco_0595137 [Tanacetum coccineum]